MLGKTFNGDVVLDNRHAIGKPITIGAHTANASTITATKGTFSGISTTGSILVYNRVGVNSEAFARITSISSDGSQATMAESQLLLVFVKDFQRHKQKLVMLPCSR